MTPITHTCRTSRNPRSWPRYSGVKIPLSAHRTSLSPSISKKVVDSYLSPTKNSSKFERYKKLSNREREVFQLIAEGHSTREIADMLCVSISTIKSHKAKIMEKLGIKSSVKLIHFAIQLGLVDPDL